MSSRKILGMGAALLFAAVPGSSYGLGWGLVNAKIRHDFPEVKRITTAELASWLEDKLRPAPLLLDVRTQTEYDVSHLQSAQRVEPDAAASSIDQPKDRSIVTYCSVGYRSGAFAQKLRAAGFSNVVNLEGSIFAWANEGRPVFHGAVKVAQVHPYNRTWGLLLRKKYRAGVPSPEAKK